MITCAQCGFDNPSGHLYCLRCKARLNLEKFTKDYFLHPEIRAQLLRQILLGAGAIFIAILALAFWPAPADSVAPSNEEVKQARAKLSLLQQGLAVEPVTFTEREASILFDRLLRENRRNPASPAGAVVVDSSRVRITPKTLTIQLYCQFGPWIFDPVAIGPFRLSYNVTGVPKKGPRGTRFIAQSGSIGHLPLPLLGRDIGAQWLERIFSPFKNARTFLSELDIIEMKEGRISVFGAKKI